ncbi:PREDICTED: leucine-rich repeat extensin-like protein 5 [Rhagoletis zephyria]|uniref:leucine-rich repeat extensin-like protein 5 n=1 Tax=Rhagoletis zephyria TaxID=28612 RepID=UPI0008114E6E|nr:PREDICTED: leucine-rich repeat extensin-like protein 5 [Rhagoletis zephyria]
MFRGGRGGMFQPTILPGSPGMGMPPPGFGGGKHIMAKVKVPGGGPKSASMRVGKGVKVKAGGLPSPGSQPSAISPQPSISPGSGGSPASPGAPSPMEGTKVTAAPHPPPAAPKANGLPPPPAHKVPPSGPPAPPASH